MTVLLILPNRTDVSMCPVQAILAYLTLRGDFKGPLFSFLDGTPVSRQFFTTQLQTCLKWGWGGGYTGGNYKGHSFRIGGATTAALNGMDNHSIQQMDRWRSAAFKTYVRIPTLSSV
ncbi:hypothetical protein SNE40_021546 [Patella caerulea]|uniref:Uncharacterized protein n=1 Tax=Patella caerulea TaxID=87958 RepID=A0AAN8GCR6_PATCE